MEDSHDEQSVIPSSVGNSYMESQTGDVADTYVGLNNGTEDLFETVPATSQIRLGVTKKTVHKANESLFHVAMKNGGACEGATTTCPTKNGRNSVLSLTDAGGKRAPRGFLFKSDRSVPNGNPGVTQDRILYNRIILHDIAPTVPANRVFLTSVKKSGLNEDEVHEMTMTMGKRTKARLLPIYDPPRHFNVLAKVETGCSTKEAMYALKLLRFKITNLLKSGMSVEEGVEWVVRNYPGHVRHGLAYQLKSLPDKVTIQRLDRTKFVWSESDDLFLSEMDKAREKDEVSTNINEIERKSRDKDDFASDNVTEEDKGGEGPTHGPARGRKRLG